MTRALAETGATVSQQVATVPQEPAFNPLPPEPVGFNGGSTEQGIEKATVKPVFKLGELEVTSLNTTAGSSVKDNDNLGSKTCDKSCSRCSGGCSGSAQSMCCC